jgi:hypothetical protein
VAIGSPKRSAHELEQHEARRRADEPSLSPWEACRQVVDEVLLELKLRR